jgi:polyisoprenoid-binding protein YceI
VETEAPQEPQPAETAAPQAGVPSGGVVTYLLSPDESSVTYEVDETFINQGNVLNTAVGTTPGVTGEIQLNFDQPQASTLGVLSVDVSGLRSDSGRRDNALRDRYLESARFPIVTFKPAAIEGLPETIEPGVEYPLVLQGNLTIRETTRPATFEARVRLEDETLAGQATTTFLMSDFGFGPISILNMLETEDEVNIRVDFVARPQ